MNKYESPLTVAEAIRLYPALKSLMARLPAETPLTMAALNRWMSPGRPLTPLGACMLILADLRKEES